MAWIQSHQSLGNHRKTLHASELLRCNQYQLIGHLHALWWWALDNAGPDGDLNGATDRVIAAAAGWNKDATRFVSALTEAGFIDPTDHGRRVHDWEDYTGRLVEQRTRVRDQTRERVRQHRARSQVTNAPGNASVTRYAAVTSVTRNAPVTQHVTRSNAQEKRREEESNNLPLTPGSTNTSRSASTQAHAGEPALAPASPAVAVYCRTARVPSTELVAKHIDAVLAHGSDPDLELWRECVEQWIGRGYNRDNLVGMLDWYRSGGPPVRAAPGRNGAAGANGKYSVAQFAADFLRGNDNGLAANVFGAVRQAGRGLPAPGHDT